MTEKHHPGESSESAPRASARPSLTGQQQAAPSTGESVSILSAVSQPRKPPPSPVPTAVTRALPWLGVLTLIAIGIVFWVELGKTRSSDVNVATTSTPAAAVAPAVTATAASTPAPAPTMPTEPVSQAATIETSNATDIRAEKPNSVAAVPAAESPKASERQRTAAIDTGRQRSPFAAMEPSAPAPVIKPKPVAPAAPKGNTDVDLLQALLSVAPESEQAKAQAQAKAAAAAKAKPKPVVVARATSKDVVNNDPVIGTAELVRRCEKLGVLESELCKTRICSGIWGKDAACPLPSTAAPEVN